MYKTVDNFGIEREYLIDYWTILIVLYIIVVNGSQFYLKRQSIDVIFKCKFK